MSVCLRMTSSLGRVREEARSGEKGIETDHTMRAQRCMVHVDDLPASHGLVRVLCLLNAVRAFALWWWLHGILNFLLWFVLEIYFLFPIQISVTISLLFVESVYLPIYTS